MFFNKQKNYVIKILFNNKLITLWVRAEEERIAKRAGYSGRGRKVGMPQPYAATVTKGGSAKKGKGRDPNGDGRLCHFGF